MRYLKLIFPLFCTVTFLYSCRNFEEEKENKNHRNKELIGFKSIEVGEPGHKYGIGNYTFNTKRIYTKYVEDIIIVKTFEEVNACPKFYMDIKYKNDTIILSYDLISDNLCKSLRIDELTYIIDNPKKKKWVFKK